MKSKISVKSKSLGVITIILFCNFFPLFLASGFAEQIVSASSETEVFWLWKLLSRLHPMAVHLPVTLLCLAALLEVVTFRNYNSRLRPGINLLVVLGAFGAVISAILGWMLAGFEDYGGNTLDIHRWTGVATAILGVVSLIFLYVIEKKGQLNLIKVYRGILLFSALGVTAAGHFGASLTHGETYITSVIPWSEDYEGDLVGGNNINLASLKEGGGKLSPEKEVELVGQVRTILAHNCYKCHSSDKTKGELRLDEKELVFKGGESGPVIIPGDPGKSEIVRRISLPRSHKESMPGKGKLLSSEEIELLTFWIQSGAPWPEGELNNIFRVAKLEPRMPELPPVTRNLQNPVDLWVNSYFTKNEIPWPEVVDDRVYLRRIYLDIVGILPSPEELSTFIDDNRSDKRSIWVRKLLNRNDDYATHWLSFWNDALRNDYSGTGYITGGRYQITDWLYGSLKENKPYNSFVTELLNPTAESQGFIKGIKWRGAVNSSQSTEMQAAQNVGQVLLGLNLKCNSCHDSFISDWKLTDAYAFANIFADTALQIHRCDIPTGHVADTKMLWEELGEIDSAASVKEKLEQLADNLVKPENGRLYRTIVNRIWAQLMGRGMVEPVDAMDNEPWSQDLLDWLASDFVAQNYDIKELIFLITTSKTYQLPSVVVEDVSEIKAQDFIFTGMLRRRMTAEQFVDAISSTIEPVYPDSALQYNPFGELQNSLFVRASLVKNDKLLTAMGRPNRENVATGRDSQASLLQAMELTNGQTLTEVLERGAKSLIKQYEESEPIIRGVYKKSLGRDPQPEEIKVAKEVLGEHPNAEAVQDFLWAVVLLPEFQFIY